MDRLPDPSTAEELKHHADRSSMRSTGKPESSRVQLGAIVLRPRRIARIPQSAIAASDCHCIHPLIPHFEPRFQGFHARGSRSEEPHPPRVFP
jgi:hypothetical protein